MYRELDVLPWFSVFLKSVEGTQVGKVGRYQGRYLGRQEVNVRYPSLAWSGLAAKRDSLTPVS